MIEMGMKNQQFFQSLFIDAEGDKLVLDDRGQVAHPTADDQGACISL
jgi:hypothetical protein